jgi:two-component system, sensor histidine kinase and response regulator
MDESDPILDPAVAMLQVEGDEEILQEMLDLFFEETGELQVKIEAALAAGEAASVQRYAHTIKSSSAMLGARRACAAAGELESLGETGRLCAAGPLFDRLRSELTKLKDAVDSEWGTG